MRRRDLLKFGAVMLAAPVRAFASTGSMTVYKTATCGCCSAWVAHMQQAGFAVVEKNVDQDELYRLKEKAGIPFEYGSCHTGFVETYFIEGHVPASDVIELLKQRPDALGLSVPAMPIGSPGMEMGTETEPFDTFLVYADRVSVFSRHF